MDDEAKAIWATVGVLAIIGGCVAGYEAIKEPKKTPPVTVAEPDGSVDADVAETHPSPPPPPTPPEAGTGTIRIASWNVLNLGEETPVDLRAQVIAQFEIVALQEIESLDGLERLIDELVEQTDEPWGETHSDLIGEGNAAEYYVYVYRDDIIDQVAGLESVYPEQDPADFSREPYFATFKAGNFDFTLITIHTDPSPQSLTTKEVQRLATVWTHVQDLDENEQDILLMGDFNKNKPTHKAFDKLEELGATFLVTEEGTFTSYSTLPDKIGAKWYDNIWVDMLFTGYEYTGEHGVDYLHERFFQDEEHPHLKVRVDLSDHCPVWAEFSITKTDDDGKVCCKTCTNSKPCGDSCIPVDAECHQGEGCACSP